jgi:hypothetical protein
MVGSLRKTLSLRSFPTSEHDEGCQRFSPSVVGADVPQLLNQNVVCPKQHVQHDQSKHETIMFQIQIV